MKSHAISSYRDYRPTLIERLNPVWWFGNVKWPEAPDHYIEKMGGNAKWATFMFNFIRNPLQNFTHYVIGISDKMDSIECFVYGRDTKAMFSEKYKLNFWVVNYRWLWLCGFALWVPLKNNGSDNPREFTNFHIMLGWKPTSGNIGGALRITKGL